MNLPADGIFCSEIAPLEFLANQCHWRACGAVRIREISSANQRNSQSSKEMLVHDSKLRRRYILNACDSLPWDNQHLSPAVIWRVNGCHRRVNDARQCPDFRCKVIAEARSYSRVRIAGRRQIDAASQ